MSTMESKKRSDDSVADTYLENHNIYESSDIGIDIAAVIQYAREHNIPLDSVPAEIIQQHTGKTTQMVS